MGLIISLVSMFVCSAALSDLLFVKLFPFSTVKFSQRLNGLDSAEVKYSLATAATRVQTWV